MPTTPRPTLGSSPDHFGTWLDGHFGWHNTTRVIEVATTYGFHLCRSELEAIERYKEGPQYDDATGDELDADAYTDAYECVAGQGGLADAATEHLDALCVEGCHFEWDCGELSLVHDEDEDDDCEGHESLDGAHMGEAVYCDGSCR